MKKYILLLSTTVMLMLSANSFAAYVIINAIFTNAGFVPTNISVSSGSAAATYDAPAIVIMSQPGNTTTLTFDAPVTTPYRIGTVTVKCNLTFTLDGGGALTALPTISGANCSSVISLGIGNSRAFFVNHH